MFEFGQRDYHRISSTEARMLSPLILFLVIQAVGSFATDTSHACRRARNIFFLFGKEALAFVPPESLAFSMILGLVYRW